MAIAVTNRKVAPAAKGQSVWVTLDATDSTNLPDITIGQEATISSSSKVGYVDKIDVFGTSFRIAPKTESDRLDSSSTPAELAVSETITLTV